MQQRLAGEDCQSPLGTIPAPVQGAAPGQGEHRQGNSLVVGRVASFVVLVIVRREGNLPIGDNRVAREEVNEDRTPEFNIFVMARWVCIRR